MTRRLAAALRGGGEAQGSQIQNRPLLLVSGATVTVARYAGHPHLGRLTQPRCGNDIKEMAASGFWWAADNDALAGLDPDAYLAMLDAIALADISRLLFVTVPDDATMTPAGPVVSWAGTLALFRSWRRALERRHLPAAIVLQDGATSEAVPWDDIAAVFVGGSTRWKLGDKAAALIVEARARGKWAHVGRINSERRERHFLAIGIDSFDGGQYSMYPDRYIPACLERLSRPERQQSLFAA